MAAPDWWGTRRFGLFVHSNLATVPAWAPIGQYSDWYRSHLGDPVPDVLLHPSPMVEVLTHHRDRWEHIADVDDFLPLLTYDRFDAEEWAGLATAAGMSYTVFVTKHHDGLCWWDAPNTTRTVLDGGPRRNVLAEYADACARAGITFGAYYSLLDWGDPRYPGPAYVDEVLHPHVIDLVERYGAHVLWGDGHWGHGPDHWRSAELIDRVRELQPDLVVNDRWWIDDPDIVTHEYETPDGIVDRPWELCRGIGFSFCHNRAERAEHHMTGGQIVALLTEVVAKGGNLLLNVGPAADGTIPELQAAPLRAAGEWVRDHADLVAAARPWQQWGDADVRYLTVSPPAAGHDMRGEQVVAVDHAGRGKLDALGRAAGRCTAVTASDGAVIEWEQRDKTLTVRRLDRSPIGLGAVYRVSIEDDAAIALELFSPEPPTPIDVGPLLAEASAGSVVQLGEGTHLGPIRVPAGVTLRGLGPDRTVVEGDGPTVVSLEHGARIEHLAVRSHRQRVAWFPMPVVDVLGPDAILLGCHIDGHVTVTQAAAASRLRACHLTGVVATGADRLTLSRCRLRGNRWDVGAEITGGFGHVVESCEFHDHLCAVRITDALDATVRGNIVEARWWAVRLVDTDAAHVVGNAITHTMRAVDVDGGRFAQIDGNAVADGDSGCIVQRGASGAVVSGNHWERCRIGLLAWDAAEVSYHDNATVDLHELDGAVTVGP